MVSINTDCGEQSTSFFYDVEQNILPFVQLANVGCLFHGGDDCTDTYVLARVGGMPNHSMMYEREESMYMMNNTFLLNPNLIY